MYDPDSIELTVSEIGYLWTGYTINEMCSWYQIIFHQQLSDPEMKKLYAYALNITTELVKKREQLLSIDEFPIPLGFSDMDINKQAPPLFSDRFVLHYLHIGSQLGLSFHARALATATRVDVREYMADCLNAASQLYQNVLNLLLQKGLYWRPPTIPTPVTQERMKKQSYLNGWLGDIRPINSMEIANLYSILELLAMIEALCIGFAQTAETEETKEILQDGIKVAKAQYTQLVPLLTEDTLPDPPSFVGEITDTQETVFSDRLMVSHIAGLFGSLITLSGSSIGSVMKHDLMTTYATLHLIAGAYAEKVTKFLIKHEWLEKVPGATDRRTLIHS